MLVSVSEHVMYRAIGHSAIGHDRILVLRAPRSACKSELLWTSDGAARRDFFHARWSRLVFAAGPTPGLPPDSIYLHFRRLVITCRQRKVRDVFRVFLVSSLSSAGWGGRPEIGSDSPE